MRSRNWIPLCALVMATGCGPCYNTIVKEDELEDARDEDAESVEASHFVEILEGLLPATGGEVELLGRTWRSDGDWLRQRLGISLQETNLADKLTVEETLLHLQAVVSEMQAQPA